jgi:hypothetical protein
MTAFGSRPGPSIGIAVPEGASSLELAFTVVQMLASDFGAVVTEVDLEPDGGRICLQLPRPAMRPTVHGTA